MAFVSGMSNGYLMTLGTGFVRLRGQTIHVPNLFLR